LLASYQKDALFEKRQKKMEGKLKKIAQRREQKATLTAKEESGEDLSSGCF